MGEVTMFEKLILTERSEHGNKKAVQMRILQDENGCCYLETSTGLIRITVDTERYGVFVKYILNPIESCPCYGVHKDRIHGGGVCLYYYIIANCTKCYGNYRLYWADEESRIDREERAYNRMNWRKPYAEKQIALLKERLYAISGTDLKKPTGRSRYQKLNYRLEQLQNELREITSE
jgi:hypothetical protein